MGRMFFGVSVAANPICPRRPSADWAAVDAEISASKTVSEQRQQPFTMRFPSGCLRESQAEKPVKAGLLWKLP